MVTAERYGIPRNKTIIFGDDYMANVLDEMPACKNKKGLMMKKYLIVPTPQLAKAYPNLQKRGVLTYRNYALWVEYPMYWVCDENNSRTWSIARVFCSFDGKETAVTRRITSHTEEIKYLQIENENLKIANMQLLDENKHLLGEVRVTVQKWKEIEETMQGKGERENEEDIPPEN